MQSRTSYGEYSFGLDTQNTPDGYIPPIIAKSIAATESDTWRQYNDNNLTLRNTNSPGNCDYGLMQTNYPANDALFGLEPSLRTDTRGNIASGAAVLRDKWNTGINTSQGSVVNDRDSERILNWYYAIASYNQGNTSGRWRNNPNCGIDTLNFACDGRDYTLSRDPNNVDWNTLTVQ